MTVSISSDVMNENEKGSDWPSTPVQPQTPMFTQLSSVVWLPRPHDRPAPVIELTICAPSTISLTPPVDLSIQLTYVLRRPAISITMLPDATIFTSLNHPTTLHYSLDLVDQARGQKYGRSIVDCCKIIDYRDSQFSYANEHNFLTLYPGVPQEVTQVVRFYPDDPHPLQADSTYQVECTAAEGMHWLWWTYGRKWQVLRRRRWPGGDVPDATYTRDRRGDPPKLGPVQLDIRVVKTCSIWVEA